MPKFNLDTAMFVRGMWTDEDGNRVTDSEYNQLLSASTWNEIDPEELLDEAGYTRAEIEMARTEHPFEDDFREYVMGINL